MSSTDTELSSTAERQNEKEEGDTKPMDFSHAVAEPVTNGENSVRKNEEAAIVPDVKEAEAKNVGGRLTGYSSSVQKTGSSGDVNVGVGKELETKELSNEDTNEAMEFEKHDSAAASAGSSPPPSSAAPDELHMDTDNKDSEEDEKETERRGEKGNGEEAEEGTKEGEDEAVDKDSEIKEANKAVAKEDDSKKDEGHGKRILPKWMVQDADAPPSPKEEVNEEGATAATGSGGAENATAVYGRGRGRGRRRGASRAVAKPHNEPAGDQPNPESVSSGRPRRSTRSNVDYAHPDAATVVAEQEDLENEKVTRGSRGRTRGKGRGRGGGRKKVETGSDEGDDDSGSEYGAGKRQKKPTGTGARGRGRGRGRAARKGRPAGKKSKKEESDDEDEEMSLGDDNDNDAPESGVSGEEEAYKPAPSKRRAPISDISKSPPKKRGRAAKTN